MFINQPTFQNETLYCARTVGFGKLRSASNFANGWYGPVNVAHDEDDCEMPRQDSLCAASEHQFLTVYYHSGLASRWTYNGLSSALLFCDCHQDMVGSTNAKLRIHSFGSFVLDTSTSHLLSHCLLEVFSMVSFQFTRPIQFRKCGAYFRNATPR